jgi:hypothetical protein
MLVVNVTWVMIGTPASFCKTIFGQNSLGFQTTQQLTREPEANSPAQYPHLKHHALKAMLQS